MRIPLSPWRYSTGMDTPAPLSHEEFQRKAARLARLSHVLDDAIRIPGTDFRIGADAIIGLIPGVGDAAGALIGGYMIYEAHQLGAPAKVKWTMARNVGIDAVIGVIPLVGDLSDFVFRANRKNMALLQAHLDEQRPRPAAPTARPKHRWGWVLAAGMVVAMLTAWLVLR